MTNRVATVVFLHLSHPKALSLAHLHISIMFLQAIEELDLRLQNLYQGQFWPFYF